MRDVVVVAVLCLLAVLAMGSDLRRLFDRTGPSAHAVPVAATVEAMPSPATIALHADPLGHFNTEAIVDGRSLRAMVDTGASLCAFTQDDAERIGLRVAPGDFSREVMTANGPVKVAPVRIGLLKIGPVAVRNVEAVVIPRGRLATNLLGMSFLKRVRDFSVAGGRLTIRG